jgi:recombination protein RecT
MARGDDTGADAARDAVKTAADNELAVQDVPTLREFVAKQEMEIARALPMGDAVRYVRMVQSELSKNKDLRESTPRSLMGAVLTAAQLGLEFGPMQQAYLIPRKNKGVMEATIQIGYRGWESLANRTGEIQSISPRTVFAGDFFEYEYGLDDKLVHRPVADDKRGDPVAYYCVVRKTNGGRAFVVMTRGDVEKHRDRYAPKDRNGNVVGPWVNNFEPMAWKTCFLRLKSWLPMSIELMEASTVDDRVVNRMTVDEEPDIEPFDDDEIVDAEIVEGETAWEREDREAGK